MAKKLALVRSDSPGPAYRVLTDLLTWPADRAVVERLLAGEDVPQDERGEQREAFKGESVTDLVTESIPALLERGWIELVDPNAEPTPGQLNAIDFGAGTPVVLHGRECVVEEAAYRRDVNDETAAFRPPRGR